MAGRRATADRRIYSSRGQPHPEQQYTVFHPSEVELAGTIQKLTQLIDNVKPERLVIDSLSELRLLAADTMRYRRQLLALKHFFGGGHDRTSA